MNERTHLTRHRYPSLLWQKNRPNMHLQCVSERGSDHPTSPTRPRPANEMPPNTCALVCEIEDVAHASKSVPWHKPTDNERTPPMTQRLARRGWDGANKRT